MSDCDLAHLDDQMELHTSMLALRACSSENAADALEPVMRSMLAARARIDQTPNKPMLAATRLAERLGLSDTEMRIVWLLATLHARSDARMLWRRIFGEAARETLDLLRSVVYGEQASVAALKELGANSVLRRFGIIEPNGDAADNRTTPWSLTPSVLLWLHGAVEGDPALEGVARRAESPVDVIAPEIVRTALERALRSERAVTCLSGRASQGRRTLMLDVAGQQGLSVLEVDVRRLSRDVDLLARQLRAAARECLLHERTPLFCNLDALGADDRQDVFRRLLPLWYGRVLVTCSLRPLRMDWGRPVIHVELADPSREQRVALWAAALASGTRGDAELLADTYPMSPGLIKRAGAAARARAGGAELRQEDVLSGIRETLDGSLGDLARRLRVTQRWDDIVLPDEQADAVEDLVARAQQRHRVYDEWGFAAKIGRGLGIAALFSGPPGTGKTMVAGLIAEALRLDIYQADMSKLVSKWIGETEKNLAELFDAAEAGQAILLFDEADSLFGKRTDVKSSNDRHANFETNFLLQRLESFTGICFMTSNHESNIDPAFHRRLSFHVRFSVPEQGERAALWRAMLPAAAPVDPGVDFDELARRFTMTGGYIKNATLRAAFMASQNQGRITMSHLMRAARLEYEAMGKIA